MTDVRSDDFVQDEESGRNNRKFSVSVNRGKASQRVRYVEIGGADVDVDECVLCEAVPNLSKSVDPGNNE